MRFVNFFKAIPTRDKILNQLQSNLYYVFDMLTKILNKNVHFQDNIYGIFLSVQDSGVADSEIELSHSLGKVPQHFIVVNINKGAIVYKGSTAWTNEKIYLKCNVANTSYTVFVF